MTQVAGCYKTPQYNFHELVYFVSQIHANGSGQNDCGQACLALTGIAYGKIDPNRAWTDIINECALLTRGTADMPGNPYTTFDQMQRGFDSYGIPAYLTYNYDTAFGAAWSVVLCAGAVVRLSDGSRYYPDSWFGGDYSPDHFCVWGPYYARSGGWVMNPLWPQGEWAGSDMNAWRRAFGAAFVVTGLPTPQVVPPAPPPKPDQPPQLPQARFRANREFGLLNNHEHGSQLVYMIPNAGEGIDTGRRYYDSKGAKWGALEYGAKGQYYKGYAPSDQKYFTRL